MKESVLLGRIRSRSSGLATRFPIVEIGPGDDCALVRCEGSTLLTVDQVIEGRHFVPGTSIDLIARKAIARSVSDIAAMGGVPCWSLATGVLPHGFERGDELFEAMFRWAESWGCPLVGGDIATVPDGAPLSLTVTVGGRPHARRGPVLRSGARAGDDVYVTGRLGGSFDSRTGRGRHLRFEPRLAEAGWLCDELGDKLRSMIDLSDGLGRDAARIGEASGVRVRIECESIPVATGVDWCTAASDGEDYELLFTVENGTCLSRETPTGVAVTRIGSVVGGAPGCVVVEHGVEKDASSMGWEHG